MPDAPTAAVFDVGRVLYDWDLRYLFEKLIDDRQELDWFLANVVTNEWHFQTDAGRPVAAILAFVLSLKRGETPPAPRVNVPVSLRFDADGRPEAVTH